MADTSVSTTANVAGPEPVRVPVGDPLYFEVLQSLWDEAATLDAGDNKAWRAWLAPDIEYEIPVRTTRERGAGAGFSSELAHFSEDLGGLDLRMAWHDSEATWAQNPQPRTRRYVTNVRVWRTDVEGEFAAHSYILVIRNRYDDPTLRLLPAERHDLLRRVGSDLKLAKRRVLLDQTTLSVDNLAFFV